VFKENLTKNLLKSIEATEGLKWRANMQAMLEKNLKYGKKTNLINIVYGNQPIEEIFKENDHVENGEMSNEEGSDNEYEDEDGEDDHNDDVYFISFHFIIIIFFFQNCYL